MLKSRRSRRVPFSGLPIQASQLSELLNVAAGVTVSLPHPLGVEMQLKLRAWPSGGALFPIEVYPIVLRGSGLAPGIHHFEAKSNRLRCIGPLVELNPFFFSDGLLEGASLVLVLTAVLARTQVKYGERGYRIALLDAGHLAQNFLLVAQDLKLASLPLGGFDDDRLAAILGLDTRYEVPVHVLLIGSP